MAITREQVEKTAKLAHLELPADEIGTFTKQLSAIIDYMDQLNELDTSSVPPMSHSTLGEHVERTWRDDVVVPSLGSAVATANAPEAFRGFFKVPAVITRAGGEGETS
jgi:aspartyl-tRNA(Asn)/glutamyl-tRNA(Gln) amidotransferase subunit C